MKDTSVALPQERKTDAHVTVAWVDLGAGLDKYGKPCPYRGLEPRTVQPSNVKYFIPVLSASASRHSH